VARLAGEYMDSLAIREGGIDQVETSMKAMMKLIDAFRFLNTLDKTPPAQSEEAVKLAINALELASRLLESENIIIAPDIINQALKALNS
jgi:hypothetical protein